MAALRASLSNEEVKLTDSGNRTDNACASRAGAYNEEVVGP